jgi:hypothetical protein
MVAIVGDVHLNLIGGGGLSNITLDVSGVVATGHLVPKGSSYTVDDGIVAGRWSTRRFLTGLAGLPDPIAGSGWLCGDSGTYQTAKELICNARDIVTAVQSDNTGAYCDALSVAFGFAAVPARFGNRYAKPSPPAPCGAQWDDDCAK